MATAKAPLPFRSAPLASVRLLPGPVRDRQERNTRYLLSLGIDRLLHNFRMQAGLPSDAKPYGGWEAPGCGVRGHFVGHYLAACAQGFAATGKTALRDRADELVAGLVACQRPDGYLSACPEGGVDAIETRFEGAWAPYYVFDKILGGLLAAHRHCANQEALDAAACLGEYLCRRCEALPEEQFGRMCRTDLAPNPTNEFGGVSETFRMLGLATGRDELLALAERFDRDWFVEPLALQVDFLTGLHSNTHIPMALGLAARHETTGDPRLRQAVEWFWERTALARSYANGGSSGPRPDGTEKSVGGEHWPAPFALAGTLTPKINESCVTHNMLRLTSKLLGWSGDARYADFYERAFVNHVLAMQHPGEPGRYLYSHPLGPVSRKEYGGPEDAFWCCYGTTAEAYARLQHGIYYCGEDEIRVTLPIASELTLPDLRLTMQADFPDIRGMRLTVHADQPVRKALVLRIPPWAERPQAAINGQSADAAAGPWLRLARTWHDGDTVDLDFGVLERTEAIPGDPATVAHLRGPHVMAQLASGGELPLCEVVDQTFSVYAHE